MPAEPLYLDHAATSPLLPQARAALEQGFDAWANPSSPHKPGRTARALLEGARARVKAALAWEREAVFTSGASEALALAIGRAKAERVVASGVEHEAVLRPAGADAERLPVDADGRVDLAVLQALLADGPRALVCVQQVNSETGVMQPLAEIAALVRAAGGILLADAAQGAGKIALPDADLIALSAHKFGGPIGIGALLIRDFALLEAPGGQERGYRGGTENLPGALAMAAALEVGDGWMAAAGRLRGLLDAQLQAAGAEIIASAAPRCPTIGGYRMPGISSAAQLIRFDSAGIAVSAGSACSSGSLRPSHVLSAMGLDSKAAGEVLRVSIGRETDEAAIARFVAAWRDIAGSMRA
ncbi:aminotransferase class V-fold PLP-dependent enzyme [Novosphingobium sp. NBM11]|uniref:cysteine desulfurase family protein n=1 Tax=Novosphingobium sp. NBM11 TaxID=2596914 RepID=UPI001892497C|nr:aminotransferase class V-fold PLP-dependent enzyme [Novosphingobium sp. NBM11]MBF5089396.1 aminotransferase class V-fold PLP-dependent enzyme [Novosphingobium sp. NBM11]